MEHSNENPAIIFTPLTHNMNLRPKTPGSANTADRAADLAGSCGGLLTGRAPLRTMNSALMDVGSAAARKLRTVKRAWGNFKSKLKPCGKASKRQRLWTVTAIPLATSPPEGSTGRYRAINSPLSPSIYQTPNSRTSSSLYLTPTNNSLSYRHLVGSPYTPDTITFGTPETDMTPLNLTMVSVSSSGGRRRSQQIARSTPQPSSAKRRVTLKRGKKTTRSPLSPGRFNADLNMVTSQMSTLAQSMQAFQNNEKGFSKTIEKQDSTSTLTEVPIQKSSAEKDDKRLGVRASQRISRSRLRQLEESTQTGFDVENGKTPIAAEGMAFDVEQERLMDM